MADAACVARSFYEQSDNADVREGGSISFGKYMSEALEWGKWSSFRQNKHVEEAEKYTKPGSVAQRKAYFEEQRKKKLADQKAKALLEQAIAAAGSAAPVEDTDDGCNHHQLERSPVEASSILEVQEVYAISCAQQDPLLNEEDTKRWDIMQEGLLVEVQKTVEAPSRISDSSPTHSPTLHKLTHNLSNSGEENIDVENQTPGVAAPAIISVETIEVMENRDVATDAELCRTTQPMKPPLQESSAANRDVLASKENKQNKFLIFHRTHMTSPTTVKPASPSHPKREYATNSKLTIINKKPSNVMNERKISAPKSLHTSIASHSMVNSTKIDEKFRNSRPIMSEATPGTICSKTPIKASTKVSAVGDRKVVMLTPQSGSQSTKAQTPKTGQKAKKTSLMCQSVSPNCWKSSNSCWKRPSQIVCTPFHFRCEERAEKRKEFFLKLEEKFNAEKLQRQAKDKEMAENELKRLRRSLGFKARPMPEFYHKTEFQTTEPRKFPGAQSQASSFGRKVPLEGPIINSFTSLRSSTRKIECLNANEDSRKLSTSPRPILGKRSKICQNC